MILIIIVCFLVFVHMIIEVFFLSLINQNTLIVSLYLSNILLALLVFIIEYFEIFKKDIRENVTMTVREPLTEFSTQPARSKICLDTTKSNLYIKEWKNKFFDKPQEFPLDRLAYLSAKHYHCSKECKFDLKNSQLKRLIRKTDYRSRRHYDDDLHPLKMVDELCTIYIHRKAAFYRSRKTTIANRKQTTLRRYGDRDPPRNRLSLRFLKTLHSESPPEPSSDFTDEESSGDEEITSGKEQGFWKRFFQVFSLSLS